MTTPSNNDAAASPGARPIRLMEIMGGLRIAAVFVAVAALVRVGAADGALALPNQHDSVKFAAIGDTGTGDRPQYDVGSQMALWHQRFAFDLVIMLGDNVYGRQRPADFVAKFERPYKALL